MYSWGAETVKWVRANPPPPLPINLPRVRFWFGRIAFSGFLPSKIQHPPISLMTCRKPAKADVASSSNILIYFIGDRKWLTGQIFCLTEACTEVWETQERDLEEPRSCKLHSSQLIFYAATKAAGKINLLKRKKENQAWKAFQLMISVMLVQSSTKLNELWRQLKAGHIEGP